jgi:signal transduction histidine kinase
MVRINITDNGKGIPEELQSKLFTPSFTTKSSGMGLGLSIVKNIIESFGGNITFNTKVNHGTTFIIELPVYKPVE